MVHTIYAYLPLFTATPLTAYCVVVHACLTPSVHPSPSTSPLIFHTYLPPCGATVRRESSPWQNPYFKAGASPDRQCVLRTLVSPSLFIATHLTQSCYVVYMCPALYVLLLIGHIFSERWDRSFGGRTGRHSALYSQLPRPREGGGHRYHQHVSCAMIGS